MNTSLGDLLVAAVLKPGLILGASGIVAACLRGSSAAARHAAWAAGIILSLALPVLGAATPALRLPALERAVERSILAGNVRVAPDAPATIRESRVEQGRSAASRSDANSVREGIVGIRWPRAIFAVWVLGVAFLAGRLALAHSRGNRIVLRARRTTCAPLQRTFDRLARASIGTRRARLLLSQETVSPAAIGMLQPAVVLPDAAESWPDADLRAVLVHELAHVARRDAIVNLCVQLTCVIYWCNPLVWLAAARLASERERACDDRAIMSGADPIAYAHLLLMTAAASSFQGVPLAAASAMARPSELESRLVAILDPRLTRGPLSRRASGALAGFGLLIGLPTAALHLDAVPPPPPNVGEPAATVQLPVRPPAAPEPDRLSDSLSNPLSERVVEVPSEARVRRATALALRGPDTALAAELEAALRHTPQFEGDLVRERAAWALAQERDGRLLEPLVDALASRVWQVQAYAAWALTGVEDDRVVAGLLSALRHPVWRVRAMAAASLRGSGDARAKPAFDDALSDPAWQVRLAAVEHFEAASDPSQRQRLLALAGDRHVAVRQAVRRALTGR